MKCFLLVLTLLMLFVLVYRKTLTKEQLEQEMFPGAGPMPSNPPREPGAASPKPDGSR